MKRMIALLLALLLCSGCAAIPSERKPENTASLEDGQQTPSATYRELVTGETEEIPYVSRFQNETVITLIGDDIQVEGDTAAVFTSRDIIFYEDKDIYESGNPYGEGTADERHTQQQAQEHLVVNITSAGAYRIKGKLDKGQIRVDLGEDASQDPNGVVELILDGADITCTVAPAILFLNVYETDGAWSVETAKAQVDTHDAGANLILQGENSVTGSHVAKIFKDQEDEKKLWKQDGAIYSYMSMNVYGPGTLDLTADNEGLDTQLHLTINGGDIAIRAQNDGINTNEDGVSVTTINAGSVHIIAGLGQEGDGIDSNGYLVINGGTVVSSANPAADAGLDSDLGSYIHGGRVIALGSTMDWAESDSNQVTMNLQFAQYRSSDSAVVVTREDGTVIFAYDPSEDENLAQNQRQYMGAVISCPNFQTGETYHVYLDGAVEGMEAGGMYDVTSVSGYTGGEQMAYTGTDVMMRPGGMGFGGGRPNGEMPEGEKPEKEQWPSMPEGEPPQWEEGEMPPDGRDEDVDPPKRPEDFDPENMPEDFAQMTRPGNMEGYAAQEGQGNSLFYMQDKVNFFSGLSEAE